MIPLGGLAFLALLALVELTSTPSDERTFSELSRVVMFAGILAIPLLALNRFTWRAAAGGLAAAAIGVRPRRVHAAVAGDDQRRRGHGELQRRPPLLPARLLERGRAWGSMTAALTLGWSAHSKTLWVRMAMSRASHSPLSACT